MNNNNFTYKRLGDYIEQRREKNKGFDAPIRGVSKEGFIPPKQHDADVSLYNVFYKNDFVYNPARMDYSGFFKYDPLLQLKTLNGAANYMLAEDGRTNLFMGHASNASGIQHV